MKREIIRSKGLKTLIHCQLYGPVGAPDGQLALRTKITSNFDSSNYQIVTFFQYDFSKASLTSFKILCSGVLHSAGLFWYSTCTKMPSNVRGRYLRVLNAHIFGVKRAWSVPLGTQRKQKRLETCMACIREVLDQVQAGIWCWLSG